MNNMRTIKTIGKILCFALAVTLVSGIVVNEAQATATGTVKLNKIKASLTAGQTLKLKLKGTKKKVTWKSSAKSVASVSKNGKVTARKKGIAVITAKAGKKKFHCKITVKGVKKVEERGENLYLKIGNKTLTASLENNSSARALKNMLANGPTTIKMEDYGNMEKVGPLTKRLPRNDKTITTRPGDLILYQGNSFVIYYDVNRWELTRLGRIQGVTDEKLRKLLGNGNVDVTLSLKR